ncbi:MAG: DUF1801 domain-containing protein [Chitinophagaceae bacterium]|nr:DUF1801 domain-containing protein [Rubrivivax sp.]
MCTKNRPRGAWHEQHPKTRPTQSCVDDFILQQADLARRADCPTLVALMPDPTGEHAVMWGPSIVGFGRYRSPGGPWPVVAFSPRKNDMTVYLMPGFDQQATLMQRLGKYKTGQVCLYLKRLADVDAAMLRQLGGGSVAAMAPQRIFPGGT